jgi:hypothetical protein
MKTPIEQMENLLKIQGDCLTDSYMYGMYNGLAVAKAILDGKDPKFKTQMKKKNKVRRK